MNMEDSKAMSTLTFPSSKPNVEGCLTFRTLTLGNAVFLGSVLHRVVG